ncbi:LysR family transcriptional regulator [Streptomyces sp. NPDC005538]|uniref:LysR family transcriptional regulator n=1 Tax=unclassified Streptomyces TaxID=2593676 RepID=UPI0033AF8D52
MQLDLNLLTALDALLEEGSVVGAADRLNLSAPAMSRTLGRIRRVTGDQILVRTGRSMAPTPYAVAVRADVHRLVQAAVAVLSPQRTLDLSTLDRTFTVQFHDAITAAIGPDLLKMLLVEAPGVRLRLLAEPGTDTDDLRHGRVDLEVGASEPASPEVRSEIVGRDRLVVVRQPDGRHRRLTIEQYAQARHVIVSRRGRLRDPIDDVLRAEGLARHVVASAPTLGTALSLAVATKGVVTVPERTSASTVARYGLRSWPLPFEAPTAPLILAWPQLYDTDPAHVWFREQVRRVVRTVVAPQ